MKKLPTRRPALWLRNAVLALLVSLAALSLPWHGDRPAAPPRPLSSARGSGPLRAGAAAVELDLPVATPIGGFARASYRSDAARDPVGARALYLEVPGARVAVVSGELLLVTEPLRRRVETLVADLRLDAVLVGATHTHAGPGGYADDLVFERAALGPWDPAVFERIAVGLADAVRRAVAAAAPARLATARGSARPLVRTRSGGRVDGSMLALRLASPSGEPISELLVFAAHATLRGQQNRRISGDWPGRFLAAPGRGVRLFLQGAVGDQSALPPPGDVAGAAERYGAAVVAAEDALVASPAIPEPALAFASVEVTLPPPSPGAVPRVLRRAVATLAWSHLPPTARVTALRVGPALLLMVPGEPTAALAERWRALGGGGSEVVSLVGGYVGYVDDAERTRRGEGEAERTYYGPELAARLEAGLSAAVAALDR